MKLERKEYQVRELVINDEYGTIYSDATIEAAAKKMKEINIPDLVVIEKDTEKVLGIIDDFDIVQNVVALGEDPKTTTVISKMEVLTPVTLDTLVSEAFKKMQDLKINIVPVVENGKLMGICSIFDCWTFIPDENPDEIGLIPVADSKTVEFWFSSICAILAFVFGILLPSIGLYGLFFLNQVGMSNFLGTLGLTGGSYSFSFFDARGADLALPLWSIALQKGPIWIAIYILSILILITGLIGLFSIIYAGFSEMRGLHNPLVVNIVIPAIPIVLIIIQWILYASALSPLLNPSITTIIDVLGLSMSIFSMILLFLAIFRDKIFRSKEDLIICKVERGV